MRGQLFSRILQGLVGFLLLLACTLNCQHHSAQATTTKASSREVVRIDSLFNAAVAGAEIPGAVVLISKHQKTVYHKAYGYQNIEQGIQMQTRSIFRMASMTKALTAVAILQLKEGGYLDLNDPIHRYLPEFKNLSVLSAILADSNFTAVPTKKEITIHQLLTHTSGIGYGDQDERYNALVIKNKVSEGFCEDERTSEMNIRKIANLPLLAEPGEQYNYGMGYDVLGRLIELISGLRYDVYIKNHILDPLEMNDSHFIIPESKWEWLAEVYQPGPNKNSLEQTTYAYVNYPLIENRQFFSGGADLCSTASDYTKFMHMILQKGQYKNRIILREESVREMLSKQTPFDDGNSDQGFAAWVTNEKGANEGLTSVGTYGFGGFFDTYSWTDPAKNFTATLLLQMYPTNAHHIHERFEQVVYDVIDEL